MTQRMISSCNSMAQKVGFIIRYSRKTCRKLTELQINKIHLLENSKIWQLTAMVQESRTRGMHGYDQEFQNWKTDSRNFPYPFWLKMGVSVKLYLWAKSWKTIGPGGSCSRRRLNNPGPNGCAFKGLHQRPVRSCS